MAKVLELQGVSFAYDRRLILEDLNLVVEEGDFLAVIGPNGGGKTTLLRLILGCLEPVRGSLSVFNLPPRKARHLIGYVPQFGEFNKDFPVSALEVVLMGRLLPDNLFPKYSAEDYAAAYDGMSAVGVRNLADYRFGELSGGQKQRTLIARALAAKPALLILDEPTSSVDSRVEQDIYELLTQLNKKVTIIMVSHDLGFVSSYINKVACLNRKMVVHNTGEISKEVISELYRSSVEMITHQCQL
jgi:zinc transport system ATP-binding protein